MADAVSTPSDNVPLGRAESDFGAPAQRARLRVVVRGAVQGVGFRPFVFRLATELGLAGWVSNSLQGLFTEVEGPRAVLRQFLGRLETEKPPRSFIQSLEASWLDPVGFGRFEIRPSEETGPRRALVLPDIATCPDCLREIFDPADRRHRYPFTNCTNCGPRFSIIESLPYDRANTSMRRFAMCPQCQAEYEDPRDRRFHAQPNACPVCGPRLELWDAAGAVLSTRDEALRAAADAIRCGQIVAVKGLGGFHLMVAAREDVAVRRLRERKHREEKPFALMFPSLDAVKEACAVDEWEERLLRSPEAPMVLLKRRRVGGLEGWSAEGHDEHDSTTSSLHDPIASAVAPGNPHLGVMLPYTPLHHLLLAEVGAAVVATSGNLSDEPICTDEREALERLRGLADVFLVHDRPIVRHVDDSIVRVMLGRELVMRRARGYAPLPITTKVASSEFRVPSLESGLPELPERGCPSRSNQILEGVLECPHVSLTGNVAAAGTAALRPGRSSDADQLETRNSEPETILAVGAHLKNSVALAVGRQVFLSQHIGDLETELSLAAFRRVIGDFERLYDARPASVAADLHPDYLSTKFARGLGLPVVAVQHHFAHVLACMAENELEPPVLGVSWDGTGLGLDGTIWGGEFLRVTGEGFARFAHWRTFRLPGGEQAVKEPRRVALGLLHELLGEAVFERGDLAPVKAFRPAELSLLRQSLERKLNAPVTSSMGRLFDAVAGIAGLKQVMRFEGQAAMELEFALEGEETMESYEVRMVEGDVPSAGAAPPAGEASFIVDWEPMIRAILADVRARVPTARISARFHNALAEAIVGVARRAGLERVVLTGGCFQNRPLTERAVLRLQAGGFRPYWHQRVPPNDGGIALGQIVAAMRAQNRQRPCA
ncbi:MAG: carbamoyltransferase HypF [Verrucomicrobia bacterium]|nr:carbamoyltransferase HypF [Verrucomicrobiota bacterium]